MKKLPIGISDFKEIIEDNYYYVDKTLLIQELKRTNGKVVLITRPRRFGKTLNLSMLKYFFEMTEANNEHLFYKTAIWQHENYRKLQGSYPVISLSFKGIKQSDWSSAYEKIIYIISQEFKKHQEYLMPHLSKYDKDDYEAIVKGTGSKERYPKQFIVSYKTVTKTI